MIIAILLIAIAVYYSIGRNYQSFILVVLSLYIYWMLASWNVLIILGLSSLVAICATYLPLKRCKYLVIIPTLLLVSGFFILKSQVSGLALPLGYSVMAFSSISLLVDQYKSPRKYSIIDTLSFILFFPKIFAGPIERAGQFIDCEAKSFSLSEIYAGIKYLIFAAFCKLIVSDYIAAVDMNCIGITLWLGVFCYSLSFFFDFWAYSLMAIGLGKIFGYNLSISFNRPYYSTSYREFWHRWNITLGTWLRDYIYIPLGGNRLTPVEWIAVIFAVFIISGIWHGTTLPFILWGICHASLLCAEHFLIHKPKSDVFKVIYSVSIFVAVSLLWQLFIIDTISDVLTRINALFQYSPMQWEYLIRFSLAFGAMMLLTSRRAFALIEQNTTERSGIIMEVSTLSIMLAVLLIFNCPVNFDFFYFRF